LNKPTSQLVPPASNELEISIFGPGYGESIVLHIGNGEWILVDSCLEPNSGEPAALQYLTALGLGVESSVKLIVATHWHDDHVRGLAQILDKCKSANVVLSEALRVEQFLTLVAVYRKRAIATTSALKELAGVLRILEERKANDSSFNAAKSAVVDRQLYYSRIPLASGAVDAKVFSVSPSDASLLQAKLAFTQLWRESETQPGKIFQSPTPNHAAVVLWVEIGRHLILLGADLECSPDSKTGWLAILDHSTVIAGRKDKATLVKVAHHGAESAHEPRAWNEIISTEPFAILTPFSRGNVFLPTVNDRTRIKGLTPSAFITAAPGRHRHTWRNKVVRDVLQEATRSIRSVHSGWGHVRLRRTIEDQADNWRTELFGDAVPLDDVA